MTSHKEIYMVQRRTKIGYRKVSRSEMVKMRNAGTIYLIGADGNELNNTVTYWYDREVV